MTGGFHSLELGGNPGRQKGQRLTLLLPSRVRIAKLLLLLLLLLLFYHRYFYYHYYCISAYLSLFPPNTRCLILEKMQFHRATKNRR